MHIIDMCILTKCIYGRVNFKHKGKPYSNYFPYINTSINHERKIKKKKNDLKCATN